MLNICNIYPIMSWMQLERKFVTSSLLSSLILKFKSEQKSLEKKLTRKYYTRIISKEYGIEENISVPKSNDNLVCQDE